MTLVQNTTVNIDMWYFCYICDFQPVNRGMEGGFGTPPPPPHNMRNFWANCTAMVWYDFFQINYQLTSPLLAKRRCRWNAAVSQEPSALVASALCFNGFRSAVLLSEFFLPFFVCLDCFSYFNKKLVFPFHLN